jgi:CRP/FNR family transcriptional regulator, cyclic AMP receptor protein
VSDNAHNSGPDSWPEDSFVALLPEAERDALLSFGTPVRFADDEVLVVQGDVGDFLYVLTHGLVKVLVGAESGAQTALAVRKRGDLVGEFGMIDFKPRTATAQAVGTVNAVRVGRTAYDAFTGQYPTALPTITRYLLSKMRATTERRAAERIWDSRALLAQVVCELAEAYGERDQEGKVRLPFTQSEVGQLAGVAVSTAERVLAEFRRTGAIATQYGAIVVRNLPFLKSIRFSDEDRQSPDEKELPVTGLAMACPAERSAGLVAGRSHGGLRVG